MTRVEVFLFVQALLQVNKFLYHRGVFINVTVTRTLTHYLILTLTVITGITTTSITVTVTIMTVTVILDEYCVPAVKLVWWGHSTCSSDAWQSTHTPLPHSLTAPTPLPHSLTAALDE
jgi:hypothetical protein